MTRQSPVLDFRRVSDPNCLDRLSRGLQETNRLHAPLGVAPFHFYGRTESVLPSELVKVALR